MSALKANITMSLDGFTAGPDQSESDPLGVAGERLHEWLLPLKAFRETHGEEGGEVNASTPFAEEILADTGAANVVQQYLAAGLLDEIVVSVVPIFLGGGTRLFENLGEPGPSLQQVQAVEAPGVTHIRYVRMQ